MHIRYTSECCSVVHTCLFSKYVRVCSDDDNTSVDSISHDGWSGTLPSNFTSIFDYDQSKPQRHACRVTPLCSLSATVNITVYKICGVTKQFLG